MDDEILDLVNEEDKVIGQIRRHDVYVKNVHNFRIVSAFLKNEAGLFWIPRRHPSKAQMPNWLDSSMNGHVMSGEDYDTAFRRETQEELRIDTAMANWRYLGKLTPHEHNAFGFTAVYEILTNETPDFNRDDFTEYFWLTPAELTARIRAGDKTRKVLLTMLRLFYGSNE